MRCMIKLRFLHCFIGFDVLWDINNQRHVKVSKTSCEKYTVTSGICRGMFGSRYYLVQAFIHWLVQNELWLSLVQLHWGTGTNSWPMAGKVSNRLKVIANRCKQHAIHHVMALQIWTPGKNYDLTHTIHVQYIYLHYSIKINDFTIHGSYGLCWAMWGPIWW